MDFEGLLSQRVWPSSLCGKSTPRLHRPLSAIDSSAKDSMGAPCLPGSFGSSAKNCARRDAMAMASASSSTGASPSLSPSLSQSLSQRSLSGGLGAGPRDPREPPLLRLLWTLFESSLLEGLDQHPAQRPLDLQHRLLQMLLEEDMPKAQQPAAKRLNDNLRQPAFQITFLS